MFNSLGLALSSGLFPALMIFLLSDNLIILMGSGEYIVQGDLSGNPMYIRGKCKSIKCQFRKLNYATHPVGCQDRLYA